MKCHKAALPSAPGCAVCGAPIDKRNRHCRKCWKTVQLAQQKAERKKRLTCPKCGRKRASPDSKMCRQCYNSRRAVDNRCDDCGIALKRNAPSRCRRCHNEHRNETARMRLKPKRKHIDVGCVVTLTKHREITKAALRMGYASVSELIRDGIERVLRAGAKRDGRPV